jgi:uncharacterized protein (DUF736 family)
MAYETKDMTGALFVNDKGGNDKRPDYRGDCVIGGRKLSIAGWKKVSAGGKVYLSLKLQDAAQTAPAVAKSIESAAAQDMGGQVVPDSDCPF